MNWLNTIQNKLKLFNLYCLCILTLSNYTAYAQTLGNEYGGSGSEYVSSFIIDSNNDAIKYVVGSTFSSNDDFTNHYDDGTSGGYILKTNNTGTIEWSIKFGDGDTYLKEILEGSDGYIYAGGQIQQPGAGNGSDECILIKISKDGIVQWVNYYGSSSNDDIIHGIFENNNSTLSIIAYNGFEDSAWYYEVDMNTGVKTGDVYHPVNVIKNATQDSEGNIIITGSKSETNTSDGCDNTGSPFTYNQLLSFLKLDPSGNLIWEKNYGGIGTQVGTDITCVYNNGLIVGYTAVGYSCCTNTYSCNVPENLINHDIFIVQVDLDGNLLWSKIYGGSGQDEGLNITQDQNSLYISAASNSNDTGAIDPYSSSIDLYLLKINQSNGELEDHVILGGTEHDSRLTIGVNFNFRYAPIVINNNMIHVSTSSKSDDGNLPNTLNPNTSNEDIWIFEYQFNLPNCEWIGLIHDQVNNILYPNVSNCDLINTTWGWAQVLGSNNSEYTSIVNYQDFGLPENTDFKLEATLLNYVSDAEVELWIYGTNNVARVVYTELSSRQSNTQIGTDDGAIYNLSSLVHDFDFSQTITLESSNNTIISKLNGVPVASTSFTSDFGTIKAIKATFVESGALQNIKLEDDSGNIYYEENFNSCSNDCNSCLTDLTLNTNSIPTGTYHTSCTISADGDVNGNNNVFLMAGDYIEFSNNFFVAPGGVLHAIINSCNSDQACNFTIEATDIYGDAWNGGELNIYINGELDAIWAGVSNGTGPEYFTVNTNIGDIISISYTEGSFDSENNVVITNCNSQIIFSGNMGDYSDPNNFLIEGYTNAPNN